MGSTDDMAHDDADLKRMRGHGPRLLILFSVFVIGACGLMYELIAGAVASYLLGDSVTQYSLVIGIFLAAMGLGSYLTQWVRNNLLGIFLKIQLAIGIVGGFSGMAAFAVFAYTDSITPVMLLITGTIGALVGMEIPLVIRLLKAEDALRVNVAQVLAVDYVGALAASIAFPFLVLPLLGLTRASLIFGMLNVLVATFGTAMFWHELPGRSRLAGWITACWIALGIGVAIADQSTTWLEDRLYQDDIILAETTPYQRIVITRWKQDIRLHLNGHLQFSTADEYRYHEALVLPALATVDGSASPLSVLVLGGGDGMAIRELIRHGAIERIDLVDIDRRVVELFRDQRQLAELNDHSLSDSRVHAHFEDAFVFLRNLDRLYDVILMDLPDPSGVATNKLYTRTFFGLALRRLTERGVLVTQASSPFYAREAFWCVERTVRSAASDLAGTIGMENAWPTIPYHVHVPSFGDWGFVLTGRRGPNQARWPADASVRFLTHSVFERARVFANDSGPIGEVTNELDDPVLVRLHNSGWARWNQ